MPSRHAGTARTCCSWAIRRKRYILELVKSSAPIQYLQAIQTLEKTHLEGLPRSSSIGPSLPPPPESPPDDYPSYLKHARPPKSRTGEKKDTTASCKIHNWKRWENKRDKRVFWSACMNGRRVWTDGAPMPRPPAPVVTFQLRLHFLPSVSVSLRRKPPALF